MTQLVPYTDMQAMARDAAASGLFGVKTPQQAMALFMLAQAEGLHPSAAVRDYHIIQGRPSMKADTMLTRFQASGGRVEWHCYTDEKVEATFSHPAGGSVRIDWTLERARRAKLAGKDNWVTHPRAMLRARLISEGVRTVYPGCVAAGVYTPEELATMPPPAARDMGHVDVVTNDPPPELLAEAQKHADRGREAFLAHWQGLTRDQRDLLRPELEALKASAERADAPREPNADDDDGVPA